MTTTTAAKTAAPVEAKQGQQPVSAAGPAAAQDAAKVRRLRTGGALYNCLVVAFATWSLWGGFDPHALIGKPLLVLAAAAFVLYTLIAKPSKSAKSRRDRQSRMGQLLLGAGALVCLGAAGAVSETLSLFGWRNWVVVDPTSVVWHSRTLVLATPAYATVGDLMRQQTPIDSYAGLPAPAAWLGGAVALSLLGICTLRLLPQLFALGMVVFASRGIDQIKSQVTFLPPTLPKELTPHLVPGGVSMLSLAVYACGLGVIFCAWQTTVVRHKSGQPALAGAKEAFLAMHDSRAVFGQPSNQRPDSHEHMDGGLNDQHQHGTSV